MTHTREEVIERAEQEYQLLEELVGRLSEPDWTLSLGRPEGKDSWTVKDAFAHIIYWKAGVARTARGERLPADERGLQWNERNHIVYLKTRRLSPQEVIAWHRQVHQDVIAALNAAPETWFSGRKRGPDWPSDLDGHSAKHRVKDIERVLAGQKRGR